MPKRVLIFDDAEHSALLWQTMFEVGGYETILAPLGTTDLRSVGSELPDLIYIAVVPGQRGVEFIKHIRNEQALNPFPIIFFTVNKDVVQSAKEAGADAVLTQPVTVQIVLGEAQRLLEASG